MREIYVSSEKLDIAHEARLRNGLKPILPRFDLALWGRRDIVSERDWKDEMHEHLAVSSYFLALLSPDYLSSDMCQIEVQAAGYRAQYEGLAIIPIIVRPCMTEFSSTAQYQCFPRNGKAITAHANQDSAWLGVLRDLIEIISRSQKYLS